MPPTSLPTPPDEGLIDLMIKQFTEGLSGAEERELERFDPAEREACREYVEPLCARIALTATSHYQAAPPDLQMRLARDAEAFFLENPGVKTLTPHTVTARAPVSAAFAWLAAAACLVLAAVGWLRLRPP